MTLNEHIPISELEPESQTQTPGEKVQQVLAELETHIRNGGEVNIPPDERPGGNGDLFLEASAARYVFEKFCVQRGVPIDKLQVSFNPNNSNQSTEENDQTQCKSHAGVWDLTDIKKRVYQASKGSHFSIQLPFNLMDKNVYRRRLYSYASDLRVELDRRELYLPPRIRPGDPGPLQYYSESKVQQKVHEILRLANGRKVVVIGQAGICAEKRYSNSQLMELGRFVRETNRDAFIIFMTDRQLLWNDLIGNNELGNQRWLIRYVNRHFFSNQASEEQVNNFISQMGEPLQANLSYCDHVLEISDINPCIAALRAANTCVLTDGYWSHLAASQNGVTLEGDITNDLTKQIIVLYTLYTPSVWAAAGVQTVHSVKFGDERLTTYLSPQDYHRYFYQRGSQSFYDLLDNPHFVGIHPECISAQKEKISRLI